MRIVFVCTGNTGRSMVAEALARRMVPPSVEVVSRGLGVRELEPEAHAVTVLRGRRLDVSSHRACCFGAEDAGADLVLTMTQAHREAVLERFPDAHAFTLAGFAAGEAQDIADAFGQPLAFYEATVAQIEGYVRLALTRLLAA